MNSIALFESIEPVNRKPVSEQVAKKLLELIQAGNLKAGDRLPTENELAAAMQVSRPVIREALRGLSILGVVESRQGGRCHVTDLSPARLVAPLQMVIAVDESNVDALYEARMSVEGELLMLAARRVTDDQLDRLHDMVEAGHKLTRDPIGFRVLDMGFHRLLMEIAGNPFLERMAASLYDLGIEYRRVASAMPGVIACSAAEHEAIVAALATRDPGRAAAAMRVHLSSIARTTYDAMKAIAEKTMAEKTMARRPTASAGRGEPRRDSP